ncbi:hypothetical protein SAMN05660199_03956 [Klenkia soli]|uniref:Uncharacterized protein n=1 Tax=Klenkia soli TaxID=1052260 RepID=A0A1H0SXR7_9ACTN|nr:hypothetical protein [Klenkia soli]SDP46371.1 hypothetical protein SAMN05660199_03956 [Klenkia soli]
MTNAELTTAQLLADISMLLDDVSEKIHVAAAANDLLNTAEIHACQISIAEKQLELNRRFRTAAAGS